MTPRLPKKSVVTRALAGGLAALYFLTNVAAVHAAENNFWKDRRRAASLQWGEPDAGTPSRGGALYARLPTAPSQGPDLSSLWEQPVHRVSQDLANAAPKNVARAPDARLLAVAQAVAPFGQVRRVKTATSTTAPLILHIQDVHGNPEAQRNMSGMVLALAQKQSPLVGLEGAAGAFDIDSFHTYPDLEIVKSVADYFLEKDLIGGPEHAGLVATKPLTLWGVEDPALYHAHVAAVKESLAGRSRADALLGALTAAIDELKKRHYSPALLDYDQNQSLYEQDRRGLGEYVDKLKGFQKDAPGRNFPNIEKLLVAAHREKTMDFDAVENERRSLVEGLAARLSVPELQNLVRRSLDLKSGSLSQRDYQAHLRELCARHKLALTRFPRLVDYMIYVADSETIERDALLDEIARLESAAQDALAQTPAQRAVVSIARDLSRLAKLVANEMTPADWAAYEPRRNEIARLGDRVKAVDGGAAVTWPADWSGFVRPFEEFCRLALSRNDALANRTLEKMKAERKSTAILVAGGFHTDGLVALLAARGAGVAVLTPKIGPVDGASNYLDVFGRDPLPVEKIFAGEPIALKDRCGLGGGELSGEQTSRVHAAIAGQTLMVALEDLRGLGHSARTMLRELRERLLSLAQEVAGLALIQPRVKAVGVNGLTFSYRAPNGREESVDFRSTDEGVSVTGRRRTGPGAWWGGLTGAVSRFAAGLKRPAPTVGAPPVIGEGSFFQVRDPGQGRLAKEVKEIVGPRGDVQYKLSEADRERLAQLTAEYSDRLRESVARASGGRVRVPVFERIGRTLWVDKAPGGPRTSESPGDRDLYLNAMRGADIALGLESLNDPIYTPDGWRIHVDRKFEGFYFSETSPEVVWIDPVTVWPPADRRVVGKPAGSMPGVVNWLKARGNDTAAAVRKAPLVESGLFSVAFLIPFVMAILGVDEASWAAGGTFALMNAYFGLQHKRVYRFQNGQWVEGPSTWKTKAWLMGVGAVVHAPLLLLAMNPLAGPIGMMGLYMAAAMASVDLHWIYNRAAAKFGLPAATVTFFDVTSTGGMPETRRNILMTLVTMETTVPEWISRIANMSDEEVESSLQRILLQDPSALSKRVTTPDNVETFVEWIRQELTGSLPQPHAYALALTRFVAHAAEREKTGELSTHVAGDLLGDLALRRPAAEKGWGTDQTKNIKDRLVGINDLLASLRTPSKEGWEEIGFWLGHTRQFESQEYERLARSGSETSPIQKLLAYQKYLLHPARPGPIHGSLAVQLANEVLGQFMSDPARAQSLLSDPLVAEDVGKIVSFAVLIKIAEKTGMNEDVFLRLAARAPSFLLGVPSPSTGLSVALEDLSPESHRAYRFVAVAAHRWMEGYVLAEIPEMAQSPAREPLLAFLGNLASHDVQAQFPPAQGTLPKILGDTAVPVSEARTAVFRYSEAVIGALSRTPYSPLVHVGIALQRLRGGVPQTWNEGFRNMMAAFFPNATPDSVAERTAPGVTVESSVLAIPQTPMNLDRSEAWLPLSGLSLQRFPLEEGARHLIHNTVTDRFIVAIRQGSVLRLYQQADSPGAPAEELVLEGDQLPGHPGLTVQWNPAVGELGLAVDPLSDQAYTVQPGPLVESIENYARGRVKAPGNVPTIWNERVVFEFDKAGRFTGIRPLRSGEDGGVRLAFNPLTNLLTVGTVRAPSGRDLLRGLEIPLRGLGKTSPESAEGLSPLWVEVHSLSSVKHPTWNEDSHFEVQLPNGIHVSAVFDGVGGQAGGEAASREASELVKADIVKEFGDQPPQTDSDIRNALEAIVQNAHTALLRHNDGRATTVVLSVSIPRGGGHDNYILEVGDSRAYWVDREGGVLPITVDSFRSEEPGFVAPRAGPVPAAYAKKMETQRALAAVESKDTIDTWLDQKSPLWEDWVQRKFIEQGLGGRDEAGAPLEVAPGYFKVRTEAGEKILLTSDGVHDNLTDQEIATHLAHGVESLVNEAHRRSAEKSAKDGLPANVRSKADDVTALVVEAPGRRPAPAAEPTSAPVREGTLGGLKEVISGIFRRTKEPAARPLEWRGEWVGDKYVLTDGGEGRFELPVLSARGADGAPLPAESFPGYMDVIVNGRRATSYKGAADDMTFEKTVALIERLMQRTTASWAFPKILGVHRVPGVAEPRLLIESFPAESSFENMGIRQLDANLDAQLTEIFSPEWVEKFRLGRFNLDRGLYLRHFFLVNGEVRYRLPLESYALESFFEYFQKVEVPPAGAVPGIVRWLSSRGNDTAEAIRKAPLVESGLFSAAFLVPVVLAVFGVDGGLWAAGGVYALMNAYFGIKHGNAFRYRDGEWQEGPADVKTKAWLAGVGLAIHAPLMLGALATPLIGPVGFLALYPFLAALSVGAHRAYNAWAQNRGWAAATIAEGQSPDEQMRARVQRWQGVYRLAYQVARRLKGQDESLSPAEESGVLGASFEQIYPAVQSLADPNASGARIRKVLTTSEREKILWFVMGELRIANDRLTERTARLKAIQDEIRSTSIVKPFPESMAQIQKEIETLRVRTAPLLRLLALASEGAEVEFQNRHVKILANFLIHPDIDINFREAASAFLSSRLVQDDDAVAAQALFEALVPPGTKTSFDRDAMRLWFTEGAPTIDLMIKAIAALDVQNPLERRLGLALISIYRTHEQNLMRLLGADLPLPFRLMALQGLTLTPRRSPSTEEALRELMANPSFVREVVEYLKTVSDDPAWFNGLFEDPLFAPEDGKIFLTGIAVVLRDRLGFKDFAPFANIGSVIDRAAFFSYWEGAHSQMSFGGTLFSDSRRPGRVFAMVAAHEMTHALLNAELDYESTNATAKRMHEFLSDVGADIVQQELSFNLPDTMEYARVARFFSPPVPGVESAHERARRQLLIFNGALNDEWDRARYSPVNMLKSGISLIRRGGAASTDPNRTFANLIRTYAGLEPLGADEDVGAPSFLSPALGNPLAGGDAVETVADPADGLISQEIIQEWLRGSRGRVLQGAPEIPAPTPPVSRWNRLLSRVFSPKAPDLPTTRFKSERVGNTLVVSDEKGWRVEIPILSVQTADGSLLSAEMPPGYLNVILNGVPAVSFAGGTDVSFEEVVETLYRLDQTTTARAVFPRVYGVHLLPGSNTPRLVVEAFPQEASFDYTHLRSPPPDIMSQIEAVFSPELAEKLRGGRFNLDQGIYARHFYWVDGRLRYRLPVETYALKRFFEYFKSKGTPPAGAMPRVVDWLKARGNDTADAIRKAPWVESGLFSLAFVVPFVMAFLGVDGASWAAGAAYGLMNAYFGLKHDRVYRSANGVWTEGPSSWKTKVWLAAVGAVIHAPLLLATLNPLAGPVGSLVLYGGAAAASVGLHRLYNTVAQRRGWAAATVVPAAPSFWKAVRSAQTTVFPNQPSEDQIMRQRFLRDKAESALWDLIGTVSPVRMVGILQKTTGLNNLELTGNISVEYFSEGVHKYVFKVTVERVTPQGVEPLSFLLAMKKSKVNEGISVEELNDLQRLRGLGAPLFGGSYFAKRSGEMFFLEEFIEGPTAQELKDKGLLTNAHRKMIASTLSRIGDRLDGNAPSDSTLKNFIIRSGVGPAIMVDLGSTRSNFGPSTTAFERRGFLFGVLRHLTDGNSREEARAVVDGLLEGLPEAKARVFVTALASEFRRLPPTNNPALTHAASVLMEKEAALSAAAQRAPPAGALPAVVDWLRTLGVPTDAAVRKAPLIESGLFSAAFLVVLTLAIVGVEGGAWASGAAYGLMNAYFGYKHETVFRYRNGKWVETRATWKTRVGLMGVGLAIHAPLLLSAWVAPFVGGLWLAILYPVLTVFSVGAHQWYNERAKERGWAAATVPDATPAVPSIRSDLRSSVAELLNAGPNTWVPTGLRPQGEVLYTRGLSGRFTRGDGAGLREAFDLLSGSADSEKRYVSLPGSEAESLAVALKTNSLYGRPLTVRGRVAPDRMVHVDGTMTNSLETGATVDSVDAFGFFLPVSGQWQWARSYVAFRQAAMSDGIAVDPSSRGAQFAADLESALNRAVLGDFDGVGREVLNPIEVEDAVAKVMADYATANSPSYGPVIGEGSFFTVTDAGNGELRKEVKEIVGPPTRLYRLNEAEREKAAALIVEHTNRIRRAVNEQLKVRNREKLANKNFLPYLRREGRSIFVEKVPGLPFSDAVSSMSEEMAEEARRDIRGAVRAASEVFDLKYDQMLEREDGWRIGIDNRRDNFLFVGDDVSGWIDAISPWPPETHRVQGPGETLRTNVPAVGAGTRVDFGGNMPRVTGWTSPLERAALADVQSQVAALLKGMPPLRAETQNGFQVEKMDTRGHKWPASHRGQEGDAQVFEIQSNGKSYRVKVAFGLGAYALANAAAGAAPAAGVPGVRAMVDFSVLDAPLRYSYVVTEAPVGQSVGTVLSPATQNPVETRDAVLARIEAIPTEHVRAAHETVRALADRGVSVNAALTRYDARFGFVFEGLSNDADPLHQQALEWFPARTTPDAAARDVVAQALSAVAGLYPGSNNPYIAAAREKVAAATLTPRPAERRVAATLVDNLRRAWREQIDALRPGNLFPAGFSARQVAQSSMIMVGLLTATVDAVAGSLGAVFGGRTASLAQTLSFATVAGLFAAGWRVVTSLTEELPLVDVVRTDEVVINPFGWRVDGESRAEADRLGLAEDLGRLLLGGVSRPVWLGFNDLRRSYRSSTALPTAASRTSFRFHLTEMARSQPRDVMLPDSSKWGVRENEVFSAAALRKGQPWGGTSLSRWALAEMILATATPFQLSLPWFHRSVRWAMGVEADFLGRGESRSAADRLSRAARAIAVLRAAGFSLSSPNSFLDQAVSQEQDRRLLLNAAGVANADVALVENAYNATLEKIAATNLWNNAATAAFVRLSGGRAFLREGVPAGGPTGTLYFNIDALVQSDAATEEQRGKVAESLEGVLSALSGEYLRDRLVLTTSLTGDAATLESLIARLTREFGPSFRALRDLTVLSGESAPGLYQDGALRLSVLSDHAKERGTGEFEVWTHDAKKVLRDKPGLDKILVVDILDVAVKFDKMLRQMRFLATNA